MVNKYLPENDKIDFNSLLGLILIKWVLNWLQVTTYRSFIMLSLEEYISKRKKKDKINEFGFDKNIDNMRKCINYVVDYFTIYLDINEEQKAIQIHAKKRTTYEESIRGYDSGCQEWLLAIYEKLSICLNLRTKTHLKLYELFLLFDTEEEFDELVNDFLKLLPKKFSYLLSQKEQVKHLFKNQLSIMSKTDRNFDTLHVLQPSIVNWVKDTYDKYEINLNAFAFDYASKWFDKTYEYTSAYEGFQKVQRERQYDYKNVENLFNLDYLFLKLQKKPYLKGKRQELEIIIMYHYLHSIVGDEGYWHEYSSKLE